MTIHKKVHLPPPPPRTHNANIELDLSNISFVTGHSFVASSGVTTSSRSESHT